MVVQRGYRQAAVVSHRPAAQAPPGYFFDVMTNGFGAMPDYRAQITVEDRWRIVAYIRALQLAHRRTTADVPAAELDKLKRGAPAPAPAAAGHGRWRRRAANSDGSRTRTSGRQRAALGAGRGDRPPGREARNCCGIAGLAAVRVGFFVVGEAFLQSYLIAYIFWIGITLGSLARADDSAPVGRRLGHGRRAASSRPRRARCR